MRIVAKLVLLGLLFLTAPGAALAQIADVAASASSRADATTDPIWAVNGAGLSGVAHTNDQTDVTWVTSSGDINGAFIIIDLKENFPIPRTNSLRIWNFNGSADFPIGDRTNRGIKTASFSYASDDGGAFLSGTTEPAASFTALSLVTTSATSGNTLDKADFSPTFSDFETVHFNEAVVARYIRITVVGGPSAGNYDHPSFVGLSEVQVFSSAVPALGHWWLVLLALALVASTVRKAGRRRPASS